jgi:hypothetical protein
LTWSAGRRWTSPTLSSAGGIPRELKNSALRRPGPDPPPQTLLLYHVGMPAKPDRGRLFGDLAVVVAAGALVVACGTTATSAPASTDLRGAPAARPPSTTTWPSDPATQPATAGPPLQPPRPLSPFPGPAIPGQGIWSPAGREVASRPAVYQTALVPGGTQSAGIAWMDTRLLAAQLYSGSLSPGGGPYKYTAPIQPSAAASLVAAFNGGFQMDAAQGGYYTEGKMVSPLRTGAASLVIYANGSVTVGEWGTDASLTPQVVAVRQNLIPLVAGGRPTAAAVSPDWGIWGNTCGATSCAASVPGIENQWRSGVGVTADGALVYVIGPALAPLQLAELLARAGVVRGMELDINPNWTVFATYDPPAGQPASASDGASLEASSIQGPATFFEASWNRDFITMSAAQGDNQPVDMVTDIDGRSSRHSGNPRRQCSRQHPHEQPQSPNGDHGNYRRC